MEDEMNMLLFSDGLVLWKLSMIPILFVTALGWTLLKGTRSTGYLYLTLIGFAFAWVWLGVFTSPVFLGLLLVIMMLSIIVAKIDKT